MRAWAVLTPLFITAGTIKICQSSARPPIEPTGFAPLEPDDELVLFGLYEGSAISTVSIVGQDEVTTTISAVVEAGARPIYLVLTSFDPVIWRFEGATSRIRYLALLGSSGVGVVGLSSDVVHDLRRAIPVDARSGEGFATFDGVQSPSAIQARRFVERSLGRGVDVFGGAYAASSVRVPSLDVVRPAHHYGSEARVPDGFDPSTFRSLFLHFSPGGLVDVDAARVVSSATAERYQVLPIGAGLAQLVASRALQANDQEFRITKPISRFPSGLYGAHRVRFVLAEGVPMPAGNPGHSCVVTAQGRPLMAQLCGE